MHDVERCPYRHLITLNPNSEISEKGDLLDSGARHLFFVSRRDKAFFLRRKLSVAQDNTRCFTSEYTVNGR